MNNLTINDETRKLLFAALGELVHRIEICGASIELTDAVTMACDLRQAVGNDVNPPNAHALVRVKAAIWDRA